MITSPRTRIRRRPLGAFVALAAPLLLALAPTAASAATTAVSSENWAGYAVTATAGTARNFSHVTAAWTEPTQTCTQGTSSYSAFWVGLGGFSETSTGLEQVGTEADCGPNGNAIDYAWYELVPAPPLHLHLAIHAGDRVVAYVTVHGHAVTLHLADENTGKSATKHLQMATPDITSAEWIAEAPSFCDGEGRCAVLPLANFGSLEFAHTTVTSEGVTGTITDPLWSSVALTLGQGRVFGGGPRGPVAVESSQAVPSALSPAGDSFTVTPQSVATNIPQGPGGYGDGGYGGGGYGGADGGLRPAGGG